MPLLLKVLEGESPRATGDEDRAGIVGCLRPVMPVVIVLESNGFFGTAAIFAHLISVSNVYVKLPQGCESVVADGYV